MMTYSWTTFNLKDALNGTLVGVERADSYDLSYTGVLTYDPHGYYEVKFQGYTLKVDDDGKVISVTPSNPFLSQVTDPETHTTTPRTLQMVKTVMGDDGATGDRISRASSTSADNAVAVLNNIQPRDQFASQILNAMLVHTDHPETFDDTRCLMYARSAYRWAQAMMIAAADSRDGQSDTPSQQVVVENDDLSSNTEKLLYNISETMKNGVTIKGTTATGTTPVQTKITNTSLVVSGMDTIAQNIEKGYKEKNVGHSIPITVSIWNGKQLKFTFGSDMAYSDIGVVVTLSVTGGPATTRTEGFILPKGSTVQVFSIDSEITAINSISSVTKRGQGTNDPNNYSISAQSAQ